MILPAYVGKIIDWIAFYVAFNTISHIMMTAHIQVFLGFTRTRLGLWSVTPKDTPTKDPVDILGLEPKTSKSQVFTTCHTGPQTQHYWDLIVQCLTSFSMLFQLHHGSQWFYPCFTEVLLRNSLHNILPKPLAAFPHNHCGNNGEEGILLKWLSSNLRKNIAGAGIKPVTSSSQGLYSIYWAMGLWQHKGFGIHQLEGICRWQMVL